MMWCLAGSYVLSLTPSTMVTSSSLAGAEMMTFFAPSRRCFAASSRLVNRPVDSITTSHAGLFHGSWAGSLMANTLIVSPSTAMLSSVWLDVGLAGAAVTESYFSRWARVLASVTSLTATNSMSGSCAATRTIIAADAAEPVDANLDRHGKPPRCMGDVVLQSRRLPGLYAGAKIPAGGRKCKFFELVGLPPAPGAHPISLEFEMPSPDFRLQRGAGPITIPKAIGRITSLNRRRLRYGTEGKS